MVGSGATSHRKVVAGEEQILHSSRSRGHAGRVYVNSVQDHQRLKQRAEKTRLHNNKRESSNCLLRYEVLWRSWSKWPVGENCLTV